MAWSVKASFQIQVEMDFAGGGSNPDWDDNLYGNYYTHILWRMEVGVVGPAKSLSLQTCVMG